MACSVMKARCSGCGCSAVPRPSSVVTSLSATDQSGASQEVTAWSFTMTRQAPHSPAPQPKCGQAKPSTQHIEQQRIGIVVDLGHDAIEAESRVRHGEKRRTLDLRES